MQNYSKLKNGAILIFKNKPNIKCPFFNKDIKLNSNGFHHLMFKSNNQERSKKEQIWKMTKTKNTTRRWYF